jgi:hypothetical protein
MRITHGKQLASIITISGNLNPNNYGSSKKLFTAQRGAVDGFLCDTFKKELRVMS